MQTFQNNLQVQLTLTRNNGLAQFSILVIEEGRVFFMQQMQTITDFFLVTLGFGLNGRTNDRFGEFNFGELNILAFGTERVAGVRIFQFNHRANITGHQFIDAFFVFTI